MELKLKMKLKMKLDKVEVEDGVEVDQILTELDQTKLNWALTQLKLKLVGYIYGWEGKIRESRLKPF